MTLIAIDLIKYKNLHRHEVLMQLPIYILATPIMVFSPESVRPFPKAGPRKTGRVVKRKKSEIITDTPVKAALEQERMAKNDKLAKKVTSKKRTKPVKTKTVTTTEVATCDSQDGITATVAFPPSRARGKALTKRMSIKKKKKVANITDSEDSDDEPEEQNHDFENPQYVTSESCVDIEMVAHNESDEEFSIQHDKLTPGDFIIVQLRGKINIYHYVARIESSMSDELEFDVTYLDKKEMKLDEGDALRFVIPEPPKNFSVPLEDIVRKLPSPLITGGTKRVSRQISFPCSFSEYNLK